MRALDRKLWRDLWHMRGQAVAIALVVMCGVATHVMFLSTLHALRETQQGYYREYRFADVFVSLKRAPEALRERVTAIHQSLAAPAEKLPDPAVSLGQRLRALRRYSYPLIVAVILACTGCIEVMIIRLGDSAGSPYYAGLNLCILGSGLVYVWTGRQTLWVCLAVLAM